MAITVDWGTRIITVPQSFLTFVGGVSYNLDTEAFKVAINDIEDSPAGIVHPPIINHKTSSLLGGIEYARIIEIINGYTVTFEDGSYRVNLIGSNNNILDVANLNSVQIAPNNSAGLINLTELQFGTFQNSVHVDQSGPYSGTLYPKGTPLEPVNNFTDAVTIAAARGFDTIDIIGNAVLDTGDNIAGYKLVGQNAARTQITVNAGAETLGCEILEAYVTGNLDGGTILRNCVVGNLNYVNGFVFNSMLNPGTISLGGTSTAHFLNCYSGVPGLGTPTIDMNGAGSEDTPLALRGYNGGIRLIQKTGTGAVSIDLASGQVVLDSSCVAGQVVVRGDGKVVDENGNHLMSGTYNGGLTLINEANYGLHVHDIWQDMGLDIDHPVSYTDNGTTTTKVAGDVTTEITDTSITRQ
jgi:hypothetical protein